MKYFAKTNKKIFLFSLLFFFILACTCSGASIALTPQSTLSSTDMISNTEIVTERKINTPKLPTKTIVQSTHTSNTPFVLFGIWKTDDMRAPDNSWNIAYSIYIKFTDSKQYVYHGLDTFNRKVATDEAELVYINKNTSIFIKKFVRIPDHTEYLGKYQKWTWRLNNGNVQFTIYSSLDSQEQSLNDSTITAVATGIKVE
jgi:hypothetical protein